MQACVHALRWMLPPHTPVRNGGGKGEGSWAKGRDGRREEGRDGGGCATKCMFVCIYIAKRAQPPSAPPRPLLLAKPSVLCAPCACVTSAHWAHSHTPRAMCAPTCGAPHSRLIHARFTHLIDVPHSHRVSRSCPCRWSQSTYQSPCWSILYPQGWCARLRSNLDRAADAPRPLTNRRPGRAAADETRPYRAGPHPRRTSGPAYGNVCVVYGVCVTVWSWCKTLVAQRRREVVGDMLEVGCMVGCLVSVLCPCGLLPSHERTRASFHMHGYVHACMHVPRLWSA